MLADGTSGYLEFLLASAAAVIPLERALTASGAGRILPLWSARTREDALRRDLDSLGATPCLDDALPDVGGEARQFGMLYVLEGSRLGAVILARHAAAHADPRVRGATRYLRHGENGRLWQSFLAALEASSPTRRAPAEAIAGARAAFSMFAADPGAAPDRPRDIVRDP
jgi:heme oxygenase